MSTNQVNTKSVFVWDMPVRLVHWLLAICFFGAYLTSDDEGANLLHVTFGYTLVALMTFRVLWGFIGSKYAKFSNFIRGPRAIFSYFESLIQQKPEHHIGHNPAGALAIVGLLLLGLAVGFSGFSALHEFGGGLGEEIHETVANLMLILVIVHICAVIASSLIHKENLVKAMLTGTKKVEPNQGITSTHRSLAFLLLLVIASFWTYQYLTSEQGGVDGIALISQHGEAEGDDD